MENEADARVLSRYDLSGAKSRRMLQYLQIAYLHETQYTATVFKWFTEFRR